MGDDNDNVWKSVSFYDKSTGQSPRYPRQLIAGKYVICAAVDDSAGMFLGHMCWGRNEYGQLGIGNTATDVGITLAMQPVIEAYWFLPPAERCTHISTYMYHTCCVRGVVGQVRCWGNNADGQLGYDDLQQRGHTQASMLNLGDIQMGHDVSKNHAVRVCVGEKHSCAIFQNGNLKCWGSNADKQLGGDASRLAPLAQFLVFPYSGEITEIACNEKSTAVVTSTGETWWWGDFER